MIHTKKVHPWHRWLAYDGEEFLGGHWFKVFAWLRIADLQKTHDRNGLPFRQWRVVARQLAEP